MEFVLIHGRADHHLHGKGDGELRKYISGIIYGQPERIFGTLLDSGQFVALCEYKGDGDSAAAASTFARLGSFLYGGDYTLDNDVAWREFGTWVAHYTGHLVPTLANR